MCLLSAEAAYDEIITIILGDRCQNADTGPGMAMLHHEQL